MRRRELIMLARAGRASTFLTLTTSIEAGEDNDARSRALVRGWQLMTKRIKRRYKLRHLPYLAVIEATATGQPHLHILLRAPFIPQSYLSAMAQEIYQSPIVWIEAIRDRNKTGGYVAKYIGKAPHRFTGCKRYWRSQDWIVDVANWIETHAKRPGFWKVVWRSVDEVETALLSRGWVIEWKRRQSFVAYPPEGL
jgi:hypothetical protein